MKKRELELQAEVDRWLEAAEAADTDEDAIHGEERGDELPVWVADKEKRLAKIREAMAALEADAKAAAEDKRRIEAEKERQREAENRKKTGRKAPPPSDAPEGKAQRNFTDPESRVLLTRDGFIQGYSAQAAVDGAHQIIVAHVLTQSASDHHQLVPLIDGIEANLGRKPKEASADSGYLQRSKPAMPLRSRYRRVCRHGPRQASDPTNRNVGGPLMQAMRRKLIRADSHAATG